MTSKVIAWGPINCNIPAGLNEGDDIVDIANGLDHGIALTKFGSLVYWKKGELSKVVPEIKPTERIIGLATGPMDSMVLLDNGGVIYWNVFSDTFFDLRNSLPYMKKVVSGETFCLGITARHELISFINEEPIPENARFNVADVALMKKDWIVLKYNGVVVMSTGKELQFGFDEVSKIAVGNGLFYILKRDHTLIYEPIDTDAVERSPHKAGSGRRQGTLPHARTGSDIDSVGKGTSTEGDGSLRSTFLSLELTEQIEDVIPGNDLTLFKKTNGKVILVGCKKVDFLQSPGIEKITDGLVLFKY
jgi:hypothetical protein